MKIFKNNSLKSSNGITLIALVITIIVLLILAGISISMLSGDNGLLKKAGDARDDTIVGQEKEQVELAYVSAAVKKLGDNVDKDDLQDELDVSVGDEKTLVTGTSTLNVHFNDTNHNYTVNAGIVTRIADGENNNNVTDGIAKDITVSEGGSAILLKNTGELYLITYNGEDGEYVQYEDEQGTQIATGVKEYYEDGSYLTISNELCGYDWNSETSFTLVSGVEKYYGDGIYISTENELCSYDLDSKTSTTLASEVKNYYGDGIFIRTTNELCSYDWDSETSTTLASGVKEYYEGYYISTANELCSYDWNSGSSTTLATGVKEYYGNHIYISTENELFDFSSGWHLTIDNEVKNYYRGGYYLKTNDELMLYDGRHTASTAEHVKEFCGINNHVYYYISTSNELYYYTDKISDGVIRAGTKASWYETDTGEIFLKYIED